MSEERKKRSVSQLNDWESCPWGFKLKRIDKLPQKPAAWFAQGLGFHAGAEVLEKGNRKVPFDELVEAYGNAFVERANEDAESAPFHAWFKSGGPRRTVEEDIERRYGIGLEMLRGYVEYTERHPNNRPVLLGRQLGVELPFETEIGGVPVRGYVDQIFWDDNLKQEVVVDLKTGKKPGDETQLGTYAIALEQLYGLVVKKGYYWMAVDGEPTAPLVLDDEVKEDIAARFAAMDSEIAAGEFEPLPEKSKCSMCTVNWKGQCDYAAAPSF